MCLEIHLLDRAIKVYGTLPCLKDIRILIIQINIWMFYLSKSKQQRKYIWCLFFKSADKDTQAFQKVEKIYDQTTKEYSK